MLRAFALALSLFCLVCGAQHYNECIAQSLYGFDSADFYDSPQNVSLSYCEQSSGNSCCTPAYSESIGTFEDPLGASFSEIIHLPQDECREELQKISCLLCNTAQANWIGVRETQSFFVICGSFCDTVYEACGDSYAGSSFSRVSEAYSSSIEFCNALFSSISTDPEYYFHVIPNPRNSDCWDSLPECTTNDFYYQYTECNEATQTRSKMWEKRPEAECKGGYTPPATETGLPCAVSCDAGQKMGESSCQDCPPGMYSYGGAVKINTWVEWSSLELPFASYCTRTDFYGVEQRVTETPCSWELNGFQVSSPSLNDSMSAYLETFVTLVENGEMKYTFMVDAERGYDGLTVYVDRKEVVALETSVTSFIQKTVPLSKGYHYIQFVYSKDFSVSRGSDMATINQLEFTHVNYASSTCKPCPVGTFSNTSKSAECTPCPINTRNPQLGATKCLDCSPDQYSYFGSPTCTDREVCTADSYQVKYGNCEVRDGALQRLKEYVWRTPSFCDTNSSTLPESSWVDCAPCEPGQKRVGADCVFCEEGYYIPGGDDATCLPCGASREAIKKLFINQFDNWDYGLSTSCDYQCATNGWILNSDHIDSGRGHGGYAVVSLEMNQIFDVAGEISYSFSSFCSGGCDFTFTSSNGDSVSVSGTSSGSLIKTFSVPAGNHTFTWKFTKNDPLNLSPDDHAEIQYIHLTHSRTGGATDCTACLPGYFNPSPNQSSCTPAPAGFYSVGNSTYPLSCPPGTISSLPGASECESCGENSLVNPDRTECIIVCGLTLDDNLVYDLSKMTRLDEEMYGPLTDENSNSYYLNMCKKEHNNRTCFDIDGDALETYACQVTTEGFGEDLGRVFGVIPLRSDEYSLGTLGVTVHLQHGTNCRNGTTYFPRQTFIDVVCDPDAGVGSPVPTHNNIVENEKCVYEFTWASLYGCPVCSERDVEFYVTECDENGNKTKVYQWRNNPRFCHDGISLPPSEQIRCGYDLDEPCGPGTYLDSTTMECTPAPKGSYSVGNGIHARTWTSLKSGFSTIGWIGAADHISSGMGQTELIYVQNFVVDGSISIRYEVSTSGDTAAGLSIYLDDVLLERINSSTNGYVTKTIPVSQGYHFLRLLFQGGSATTATQRGRSARVSDMVILGINMASEYPLACPPGTASNEEGSTFCRPCDWNTHSPGGLEECAGCLDYQYAYPGSVSCSSKHNCTMDNFHQVYSPCEDGFQMVSWIAIEPLTCDPDGVQLELPKQIPCGDCQVGEYRSPTTGECEMCESPQYWDQSEQKCKLAKKGYAAIAKTGYWTDLMTTNEFPEEFSTGCRGDCICSGRCPQNAGWRFFADHADSGSNPNREVDTYLELEKELDVPGSLEFYYSISGSVTSGLEFFINGKQYPLPYHPVDRTRDSAPQKYSFDLDEIGTNTIRWNFHQEPGTTGTVRLSNITLFGVGGATEAVPCPSGEYSPQDGMNYCEVCPAGTASFSQASSECSPCTGQEYSELPGSSTCSLCGKGTTVNANGTDCVTDCVFQFGDDVYDLSPLSDYHGPYSLNQSSPSMDAHLWMNLCAKKSSNVVCIEPVTSKPIHTYMCQVDSLGYGVDIGHLLAVQYEKESSTVKLSYTDGKSDSNCTEPRSTTIALKCLVDETSTSPRELASSKPCDIQLEWKIAYACPVCQESDYEPKQTGCSDGERTLTYMRVRDCYGPAVLRTDLESCAENYSVSLAFLILIGVVIVILLAIIVAAVIYSRRLQNRYSALVSQTEGHYEMKDMENGESVLPDQKKDDL